MRLSSLVVCAAPAVIAVTVGGCVSLENVAPPVTPAMTGHGASLAMLNEGRRVFAGPCTACHTADPVSKHGLAEWHDIVDDMAPRAKLDLTRRAALLAYITAVKSAPVPGP
jgi:hypothetical protein